jgi:F0F1-type ATP synthase membrane subunit a
MLNDVNRKENEILLLWAIGLALFITCLCVFVFSIMTCLCCRKQNKDKQSGAQNFLQFNEDFQSEKVGKSITEKNDLFISILDVYIWFNHS